MCKLFTMQLLIMSHLLCPHYMGTLARAPARVVPSHAYSCCDAAIGSGEWHAVTPS
jgi:hypothetical protein